MDLYEKLELIESDSLVREVSKQNTITLCLHAQT